MAPATTPPPTTPPDHPPATPGPDLVGLARDLAAKHAATGASPPLNKGGRRTVAEEAADYCRKHGLQMVPATESPPVDAGPAGPPAAPGYVVSPDFVRQMAKLALEGLEAYRQRATFLKARAIGADKDLARELAEGAGAPPGAIEVMSYSLAEMSQKYDWLSQWTPEVAILMAAGAWLAKDVTTMRRLTQLGDLNRKAAGATDPSPDKNPGHGP